MYLIIMIVAINQSHTFFLRYEKGTHKQVDLLVDKNRKKSFRFVAQRRVDEITNYNHLNTELSYIYIYFF